jgi:hypothetical protein
MMRRSRDTLALALLVVRAWMALLIFDVVRLAGFGRIHRLVDRCPVRRSVKGTLSLEEIVWAVDEACVWYVKACACLQRSVVSTWMLRRRGFYASLVIGYRPIPFESHAWVEVGGVIVNDRPQYQKAFRVLERL